MLKIAIIGPESSGKTTLAKALAAHFGTSWVPEYAREYLQRLNRPYAEEDLWHIAEGQLAAEHQAIAKGPEILLCDTDILTISIWSREKFGQVDPRLEALVREVSYDHTLICRPDMPWEPDPLRENPNDRDRLFGIYLRELDATKRPYVVIEGNRPERLHRAVAAITTRRSAE